MFQVSGCRHPEQRWEKLPQFCMDFSVARVVFCFLIYFWSDSSPPWPTSFGTITSRRSGADKLPLKRGIRMPRIRSRWSSMTGITGIPPPRSMVESTTGGPRFTRCSSASSQFAWAWSLSPPPFIPSPRIGLIMMRCIFVLPGNIFKKDC